MKNFYLLILGSLIANNLHAQELVPNPDFESHVVCPTAYNQVTACVSWFPAPDNIDPLYGTEYMNACASGLFNVPSGTWGYQVASSGNGYMALSMMAPAVKTNYRENIYAKLISKLTIGATYSVSAQISFTDNSKYATNNFGVKFGKAPTFPINNSCQINSAVTVTNSTLWTAITGTFVADSAYEYVAVGNFHTDAMTTTVTACPGCPYSLYGYFIDDVSVTKIADPIVAAASPCDSYNWATWIASASPTMSANSTILCDGLTHSLTVTSNYNFDFTPSIFAYGVFAPFPGALPPSATCVRTNWSDPGAGITSGTTTICFTSPVTSPVLLLSSIGNPGTSVPLKFSNNFNVIFDGGGLSGISTNSLVGKEGYAILEFPGAFTCVSIVSDAYEFYANLTWGIKNQTTHSVVTTSACSGNNNGTALVKIRGTANTFTYSLSGPTLKGPQTDSTFTGLATGTYTYLIQNNVPCSYTGTFVIGTSPSPTLVVTATPSIICAGNSSDLLASGADTYTWSTGSNTNPLTVSPSTTTTYTVEGTNSFGCISNSIIAVSVINPSITVNSNTLCIGQSAILNASGVNTYSWSTGSSTSSTTINPTTTTTYTVQGTDLSGCTTTQTTTVEVLHPIAKFEGIDKSIYDFGEIIQLTNTSIDATNYEWIFCNGTLSPNVNVSVSLLDSGNCCIKLIAKKLQCADTTSKCFYVNPETYILIPNVFTPNGDGSNERFKIKTVGVKDLHCTIFDRWGLKLYEWDGVEGYWDGKAKTGPAPSGTYFYIVTYTTLKGSEKTEKGFLSLFN